MPTHQPTLASWLRSHHGVVSRLSSQPWASHVAKERPCCTPVSWSQSGRAFIGMLSGLTRSFRSAPLCAQQIRTLVITCGGAGRFWGFRRCAHVGTHVSGTGTGLRFVGGPLHHRCPIMPIEHIHFRNDGIRVTGPARTVFDLAKHIKPTAIESVIEQGLRQSLFDIPTLYGVGRTPVSTRSPRIGRLRGRVVVQAHLASTGRLASGDRVAPSAGRSRRAPRAANLV